VYFDFSKEQYMGRDSARAFFDERLSTTRLRQLMATVSGFDRDVWRGLAELGFTSVLVPEAHGGLGLGFLDVALLLEESGRALLPAPIVETAVVAALALAGADRPIRERWLPAIAGGEVVATVALGGREGLPLPRGLGVRARRDGATLVLDGEAFVVPFGHVADLVLVAALVDGGDVALALVEPGDAGVSWQQHESIDPTFRTSALRLDGVRVAADRMIAGPSAGVLDRALAAGRAAIALQAVGGASRPLEMSVEYAKVRQQFGQPIGTFQAIKHRCADMLVAYETTRAGAYYAAWAVDAGAADAPVAAAMAKALTTEMFRAVAGEAIQVHGGIGFTWEHDLHLFFKRSKYLEHAFGPPAECREVVAAARFCAAR
jgi:alkylation response protein AidB-like acyl-CoA dehydrogenase